MSFTVLQNIIVKGVFSFSIRNKESSQLKQWSCLSACKTENFMLSLLGLTVIRLDVFNPRHLIKRSRISLLTVAVRPRRGIPVSRQDLNSATLPNAS